jgi:hypothetical protein
MTRADKVAELAQFILSRDESFKHMHYAEYDLHRLALEDEIRRAIVLWLDQNASAEP